MGHMGNSLLRQIETVPVGSLEFYPGNPRRGNVEVIAASLRENEQYAPLVVQKSTRYVLAGNHTLRAARSLGWEQVDVVMVDVNDDRARKILLSSNRTAELGTYDDADLAALLVGLDGDYLGTGWGQDDLDALLTAEPAPHGDPDDTPELPAGPPITQAGDIWQLGPHRLICGDCRDFATLQRLLDGHYVNVAFTSPPYASQRAYDETSGFRPIPPGEYVDWFEDVQAGVRAVLVPDGSWFVNIKEHCDDGQRHLYVKDLTIAHVRRWMWQFVDELCWVDAKNGVPGGWPNRFKDAWEPVFHFSAGGKIKFNPLANGTESDSVFNYSPATHKSGTGSGLLGEKAVTEHAGLARPSNVIRVAASSEQAHSAAFPVALPVWFIRAYSDPGDTVLDPFMGSGSTLIAAHLEQRIAYGCEISPGYCDVIVRRFKEHAGIEPELASRSSEPVEAY